MVNIEFALYVAYILLSFVFFLVLWNWPPAILGPFRIFSFMYGNTRVFIKSLPHLLLVWIYPLNIKSFLQLWLVSFCCFSSTTIFCFFCLTTTSFCRDLLFYVYHLYQLNVQTLVQPCIKHMIKILSVLSVHTFIYALRTREPILLIS